MILQFWRISFITLLHCVSSERHVVSKYETYLILETILNASIIKFDNSIMRLINDIDDTYEITSGSPPFSNIKTISETPLNTFKLPPSTLSTNNTKQTSLSKLNTTVKPKTNLKHINFSKSFASANGVLLTGNPVLKNRIGSSSYNQSVKLNDELSTAKSNNILASQNASDSNHKLNNTPITKVLSPNMKQNTTLNIIATNKTDVTKSLRSLRRQMGKMESAFESIADKVEGKKQEQFYEPFWPGGQYVFLRTGSKQENKDPKDINKYTDCDRICSVFEDRWYGRICACRRDDWWVDLEMKNFTSLCAMERANCEDPVKRPGWYPLHRGYCTYPNNPHEFLSTFDEMYEASTIKFFSRADFYEKKYGYLYVSNPVVKPTLNGK